MAGIYGNSKEDRHFENILNTYLDSLEHEFSGNLEEYTVLFENSNLDTFIEVTVKNIEVYQDIVDNFDIAEIIVSDYTVNSKLVELNYDELAQIFNIDFDTIRLSLENELDRILFENDDDY